MPAVDYEVTESRWSSAQGSRGSTTTKIVLKTARGVERIPVFMYRAGDAGGTLKLFLDNPDQQTLALDKPASEHPLWNAGLIGKGSVE